MSAYISGCAKVGRLCISLHRVLYVTQCEEDAFVCIIKKIQATVTPRRTDYFPVHNKEVERVGVSLII